MQNNRNLIQLYMTLTQKNSTELTKLVVKLQISFLKTRQPKTVDRNRMTLQWKRQRDW